MSDKSDPTTIEVRAGGGERVPALGFGTWMLNGEGCVEGVADALRIGYRHIDTAQVYENEAEVGEGLRRAGVPRRDVFITTKVQPSNYRRTDVGPSVAKSLAKLGTEYVDLLLMHWPSDDVPLEETLAALVEAQQAGYTRHIGVSNFPPSWVERAISALNTSGAPEALFCNQVEYHPFLSQERLVSKSREHGFLLVAYCPLARGRVMKDDTLTSIGTAHGKTAAQVALRWLLQHGVCAIPKAAAANHRRANFDVFDFELSDEEMNRVFALDRDERLVNPEWGPGWERG
jgi:diketogulonate reductase-like aldo/keto reductase